MSRKVVAEELKIGAGEVCCDPEAGRAALKASMMKAMERWLKSIQERIYDEALIDEMINYAPESR